MYKEKKVVVVLPAYNAAKTLEKTYREIPFDIVDEVILCDDHSRDNTAELARTLGYPTRHCASTKQRLWRQSKVIVQQGFGDWRRYRDHVSAPDYQYTPKLIPSMVNIIGENLYPVVLGSRILGMGARRGGMPLYKYIANRFLTFFQNLLIHYKLSEYHTGYRAFSREVLLGINFNLNSDDFVFDNEMLIANRLRRI